MKYHVTYAYGGTMEMPGYEHRDYGIVEASSPDEAMDFIACREVPNNVMYGPDKMFSSRGFFLDCLSATDESGKKFGGGGEPVILKGAPSHYSEPW